MQPRWQRWRGSCAYPDILDRQGVAVPDDKLLVVEELRGADGHLRALRADVFRAERVRSQHPDGGGVRALPAR